MKRVVITGGASGIGRRLATGFAAAGYEVFALDKKNTTFTEEHIRFLPMDLEDESQIHQCFQSIIKQHGEIHVLINNGAVSKFHKPVFELTPQEFDWVIRTNLRGAFLCCKKAARLMMRQRYGRVINLSSVVGLRGNAGQVNYAASKAGVIGMTKSLAKELASRGVTVNAVAPGFIDTDMTAAMPEAAKTATLASIPMQRLGAPEDIAKAVAFLASDDAASITGQVIAVDGGMAM